MAPYTHLGTTDPVWRYSHCTELVNLLITKTTDHNSSGSVAIFFIINRQAAAK